MSIAAVKPDQGTRVLSYAGALLETMDAALADHANVFIMGQGVDDFKGIFGSTTGLGYWRNPKATTEAFFPGGWLRTGDIGRMRDGLLFLASRKTTSRSSNAHPTAATRIADPFPKL